MAHLIQRLTVELAAPDTATARRRQEEVSQWLKAGAWQLALSEQLDRLVPEEMVLRIPRIEIDIHAGDEADFQKQMVDAILNAVGRFEQKQQGKTFHRRVYMHEIIIFYLENGYLPATAPSFVRSEIKGFIENLPTDENPEFWQVIRSKAGSRPAILRRLYQYLGITNFRQLICKILGMSPLVPQWLADFQAQKTGGENPLRFDKTVEVHFWQMMFLQKPADETFEHQTVFKKYLTQQINAANASPQAPVQSPEKENDPKELTETSDAFFIENAGLVLLAPFLSTLFNALGWVKDKEWVSNDFQQQAVRLLAYMSHGTTDGDEFEWPLNKVLCGLPVDAEVDPPDALTPDILTLADELLAAVIAQWTVLKTTSVAGLRERFLAREGKLSRDPGGEWRMLVPRQTIDVLLDRIPWGFSVIKLPWMSNILFVDW
ncbi:hypothetical protein SAMN05216327_102133 [Dyadobacter sp. SG02]|uniref:contractile injection system tape measure protein n=1 Tax=Dyadobacter sp. SG02 TaxID=1855291 RepID=UPI0008B897C7|nr:contractile injection system tape measure protein [Dyadobacter sp. SG02]SEI51239.1 hypothetical protein SAMN05216327_102133 [Dyadobacter sp. SG02]